MIRHGKSNWCLQKAALMLVVLFLVVDKAQANLTGSDATSGHAIQTLSTNWIVSVKEVLPEELVTPGMSFQAATNLLCHESQKGNNAAQGLWGFILVVRSTSELQIMEGLRLLHASAEKGYVLAMLNLGYLLKDGKYVERNDEEAFQWFTLASNKGHPEADLQVGVCYHHGLGVTRDLAKAAQYYSRAAAQTNYVAMKSLGFLLMNGLGVEKDVDAARKWLYRSATEGQNRRAMHNLGVISFNLHDTNALAEAYYWFKKSADLGDPMATLDLAKCYYFGWGTTTNYDLFLAGRTKAAGLAPVYELFEGCLGSYC